MEANTTHIIPPLVFDGEEYDLWAAMMTTHLKALDLWEPIEEVYTVWPLPEKSYSGLAEESQRKEDKKCQGQNLSFLFSFKNHIYENYEFKFCEGHLGLPQSKYQGSE